MVGWMSNWQYAAATPTTFWRGLFTLPRMLSLTQTGPGVRLAHQPVAELKALRRESHHWHDVRLSPGINLLEARQFIS